MPYFAGEYAAAPSPPRRRRAADATPNSIIEQPTILTVLATNITWPLGIASANAPTNGASTTYETVKKNFSIGVSHAGESSNAQYRDRRDEQRIVGERREKLRRHDDEKTERHEGDAGPLIGGELYTIV